MIEPDYNPLGECSEGYKGILCTDCEPGYSRSGSNFRCDLCPEPGINSLRLIGVAFAFVLLMIFIIRSTLKGATDRRNITSVF